MTALLEVEGLTAAYGPVRALHGVDLSVAEGRVVRILTPPAPTVRRLAAHLQPVGGVAASAGASGGIHPVAGIDQE